MHMKTDMIESLRWVQKEISVFGGDPSRVTIMGHSSGSMAVSLLTMLPTTEGLFSQAICMSGSHFTY
jgi:para-nitrobenzyl esterase